MADYRRLRRIEVAEQARAADYFKAMTTEHEMTVLHDEGVYRHVRFTKPGTSIWAWSLVTWPGHLAISGDLQSFTFAREPDMFEFFAHGRGVNPDYWAEKVIAGRDQVRAHSAAKARQLLREWSREMVEGNYLDLSEGLAFLRAVRDHFDLYERDAWNGSPVAHGDEFHHALDTFRYNLPGGGRHSVDIDDGYEWDATDHDWHYLMAIHAVRHGVDTYRATTSVREPAHA